MSKPKLLCTVNLSSIPDAVARLGEMVEVHAAHQSHAAVCERIGDFDAYWGHFDVKVDAAVLDRAPKLKLIATATTGTDHIDKALAAQRGIEVLSTTTDYELLERFTATAELAWTLLLMGSRHLRRATREALAGQWPGEHLMGRQLSDMTLGVLGVGRLGRMTCRYGRAFCRRVIACDRRPFKVDGVEPVSFDDLIAQSDAISIHIHATPENLRLFNTATFARMKPGAILVNTSRGDILDETALLAALESGRLAAFGGDVLHNEWQPDMASHPVIEYARRHENVIITPHIGGATDVSIHDARIWMADKISRAIARWPRTDSQQQQQSSTPLISGNL